MTTRKVLFVLSLALFINPTLHCMEDKDTENSKNVVAYNFHVSYLSSAIIMGH